MGDDLYFSSDDVETLKVEEEETYDDLTEWRQARESGRAEESADNSARRSRWKTLFIAIAAVILLGAGNLWALLLLIPAASNWSRAAADRDSRRVTRGTRKALRGAMFSVLFAFMFLFNAWSGFLPLLLIGWGATELLANSWQRNEVAFA